MRVFVGLAVAAMGLAACEPEMIQVGNETVPDFERDLPPAIAAAAATWQNLDRVTYIRETGCYWYEHRGPVETTVLPLRSKEGRPICTKVQ